jgi:hypothetical protein
MADLRASLETEIESARQEYEKMDSHIKQYTDQMDQFIT